MSLVAAPNPLCYATTADLDSLYPSLASVLTTSEKERLLRMSEGIIDALVGYYVPHNVSCTGGRVFPRECDCCCTTALGAWDPNTPLPTNIVQYSYAELSAGGTVFGVPVTAGQWVLFVTDMPLTSVDIVIMTTEPDKCIPVVPYHIHEITLLLTHLLHQGAQSNPINSGSAGGVGTSPISWMGFGDSITLDDFSYKKGTGGSVSNSGAGSGASSMALWLQNAGPEGAYILQIIQQYSNFTLPL